MNRQTNTYEFGRFRLLPQECLLMLDAQAVPLEPQVFKTLEVLVENSGHLCEKSWLLQQVWGETFVEESNLARNISVLRKVLGDGVGGNRYIETVPKRGYRFVANVKQLISDETLLIEEHTQSKIVVEEETDGSETVETQVPVHARRTSLRPSMVRRAYVVAAFPLVLLVGAVIWFYYEYQNRRWAHESAIPEIDKLISQDRPLAAYLLSQKAERYLHGDTALAHVRDEATLIASIQSSPAGATVEIKDYLTSDSDWFRLGTTPLEKVRIPAVTFAGGYRRTGFRNTQ